MMMLISKRSHSEGSFRFTTEFNTAVSRLANRVYQSVAVTERGISIYRHGSGADLCRRQTQAAARFLKVKIEDTMVRSFSLAGKISYRGAAQGWLFAGNRCDLWRAHYC